MADVITLTGSSRLHILRWQARLGELRRRPGAPGSGPGLAVTWDTVTCLIDLHMAAGDEICGQAVYGSAPPGLARSVQDAHHDIREVIGEARLQPPGSPPWWRLTAEALAAWSRQADYEEHVLPAACRRADPAVRDQLARQWRAFREAAIRDRSYPDAPPRQPTCRLRRARPATPRLAAPAFAPLACTCPRCSGRLAAVPPAT